MDSGKHALTSSQPTTPVVSANTDLISQEAYVTETSGQTAHGAEPVLSAQAASTTTKSSKGGPINAIRNFFSRIFNSHHRHEDRQKSNNDPTAAATVQTTETVTTTTTATVATSNPTKLS